MREPERPRLRFPRMASSISRKAFRRCSRVDSGCDRVTSATDLLIRLVETCGELLEEADDSGEIQRLKRIRNEATIELAEHARPFGTTA